MHSDKRHAKHVFSVHVNVQYTYMFIYMYMYVYVYTCMTCTYTYCGGRADANPQVVLGRRQRAVKSEAAKGAGPFRGSLPARRSRRAAQAAHRERRQVGAQGTPQSQTITHVC